MSTPMLNVQELLDKISLWLSRTTEYFDDWDWDGNELVLFLNEETIERYSYRDVIEFLK